MKKFIKLNSVESKQLLWLTSMLLILISGFIGFYSNIITPGDLFIGLCCISGFGYIGSLMKPSKLGNTKQLLNEYEAINGKFYKNNKQIIN